MANTGIEIPLTLKEVIAPYPPGTPTGNTKPNSVGDPDYIAPFLNTTNCPITYLDTCPVFILTGKSTEILYEFSLENSVVNNPNIKKIKVALNLVSQVDSDLYVLPNITPNYFSGSFTGLTSGTAYNIVVTYLDSSDTVVKTCDPVNISTI